MSKTKSNNSFYIVLIVIISTVILGLVALLVIGIVNKGFGFNADNVSQNLVFDREFLLDDIRKVDADIKAGVVTVHSTQRDVAEVKFYAEKSQAANVYTNGGSLVVEDKNDDCHFICLNWRGVKVEIYLPENYDGEIKIKQDTGRMAVGDFANATANIDNDMGDVELGSIKNIVAKLDMGKLTVADCLGKINAENDMGDIEIQDLHLTEDSEIKLDMGNIEIKNVGDVRVDADVSLGNKEIGGGNYKSDVVLKIKNNMGNITVR